MYVQINQNVAIINKIENILSYIYLDREIDTQLDHSKETRRRIKITRTGFVNTKMLCLVHIILWLRNMDVDARKLKEIQNV